MQYINFDGAYADTDGMDSNTIVTWAMFEGLIAIIEAWFYREMPSEGWECHCDRDPRAQETTCVFCGANLSSNSRDVLRVYSQLKQIVGFIDERSAENQ